MTNWPILTVAVEHEGDIVAARQRGRRIAELLGFERQDQTRIATAISEIARNAHTYGGGGKVEYSLHGKRTPAELLIRVTDHGPGITDLDAVMEGRYASAGGLGLGLLGAQRLMDGFLVEARQGGRHDRHVAQESALRRQSNHVGKTGGNQRPACPRNGGRSARSAQGAKPRAGGEHQRPGRAPIGGGSPQRRIRADQ